jgi:hypothetical protein
LFVDAGKRARIRSAPAQTAFLFRSSLTPSPLLSPLPSYNEREYRYVAEQVWTFERTFDVSAAMLEHKQVRGEREGEGKREGGAPVSGHRVSLSHLSPFCLLHP